MHEIAFVVTYELNTDGMKAADAKRTLTSPNPTTKKTNPIPRRKYVFNIKMSNKVSENLIS